MNPRNERSARHDFSSEKAVTRYWQAKRRTVDRLSRISVSELRGESRAGGMLRWSEVVDLFVRRARIRAPKKGTLAQILMISGLRVGRFLDRVLEKFSR